MIWDLLTPSLNMLYAYFAAVLLTIIPSPHWTQQASWQKYEQDQKCRCNRPEFPPSQFFPRGKNGPAHSFPGEKTD